MHLKLLIALLALCALILGLRGDGPRTAPPRAYNGTIDLRNYDFEHQATVTLDGEWDFYWQRFVAAHTFENGVAPPSDGLISLPDGWKGKTFAGRQANEQGFATLHLRILTRPAAAPLALRLVGFYPANRIWVNGQLASETGRIAERPDGEVMNLALQIVALPNDGQPIELVIHASNFNGLTGVPTRIDFGQKSELDSLQMRKWALAMFSVGTLLLMSFYHLALYYFRRSDAGPLYLGLNCLFWVGNILCIGSSEWLIRVFLPDAPGEVLFRIWPLCLFFASALAYQFYRALYPNEFPRWIAQAVWIASLVYALIDLVAPTPFLAAALPGYYLISMARMAFTAWALLQAWRHQRSGALIILCGYLLMLLLSLNDILSAMGIIHTPLVMHLGMIVYMFSQSLALALRFSTLHASVENLSSSLESKNQTLGEQIAERARLQHEIVSVSEEERRRMSHELHDGLCQQLTAARLQCAGLAKLCPQQAASTTELARLSTLLDESVDHAYDLAHGMWPMDPDCGDIGTALSALVQRQSETSASTIDFKQINACPQCAADHTAQLYGIAREAINNAVKHAAARRITVTLDCSPADTVTLTVDDDGHRQGPAKASRGGLGMRIMVYRAQMAGGEFAIETPPTGGTRVRCTLPCTHGESA